ncbi:MAG: helix-turn-helix transcriptional regulator [Bifidobacteriaceae bacterium]|nr:helix-turn-helix transcriptional regulator [Bifidobacteriaceae bacterium]
MGSPAHHALREEASAFFRMCRARLSPTQAGLPVYHGRRRVAGLRREEVALLAGISVEYYTRIERGNLAGVSPDVLSSLSGALRLDRHEARFAELLRSAQTERTGQATGPGNHGGGDSGIGTPFAPRFEV